MANIFFYFQRGFTQRVKFLIGFTVNQFIKIKILLKTLSVSNRQYVLQI